MAPHRRHTNKVLVDPRMETNSRPAKQYDSSTEAPRGRDNPAEVTKAVLVTEPTISRLIAEPRHSPEHLHVGRGCTVHSLDAKPATHG